jgi:fibronectin-binding autotransporter adhesin
MSLQHYRSSTANKRPVAANMADGQIAVNTAGSSPGLFIKDSGGAVVKIGPVHVGSTAPNSSPAIGGSTGNSVGEIWLDTTGGNYAVKIWDGTAWRSEDGIFVNTTGDTMTGNLTLDASSLIFDSGLFNTTISATTATAARSILLPDAGGTVVVTGATGQVTSAMIADGTIVDGDISASAEIAVSKLANGTARQLLQTDTAGTGVEWTSNLQIPGSLGVTGATTFTGAVTSNNNITLNAQSDLRFADSDSSNWVAFQAPATVATNVTWTLPSADGSSNQILRTDGAGNLSWISQTTGGDVFLANNNAFTGANTFFNATGQVIGTSSTQDSLLLRGRTGGTTSLRINLEPAALSQTRTIVFPNTDGNVVTTGDTGTVTSAMIAANTIVDADVSASAEIAVSKLANGTARQLLQTDTVGTGVEWTSNLQIPGSLGVTGATTFTGAVTSDNNITLNAQNDLRFADSDSSNWVALQAPATVAANVTWTLPAADGSSNQILKTDGAGNLGWVTQSAGGDVFANGTNAFTGANTFYNNSGQTFGTGTGTQDGIVLAGRAGGTTSLRVTFVPDALTGNRTLTLPNTSGTIITSGDTGTVTSTMLADLNIVNADINAAAEIAVSKLANGTARQLLQTDADGISVGWTSNISIPGTLAVTGVTTLTGSLVASSDITLNAQNDLRFADADNTNWVAFQAPTTVASNVTWTLPAADGTSGQLLTTNGAGTLSWTTVSGGGVGDVVAASNNAFTGANTFYNSTGQTFGTSTSTQDGIVLQGRAGGTLSYRATIVPTSLTGNRTLTLPNETGTFLTSSSTGAIGNTLLTNSSVTVNGTAVSLGGSATVTANTTNALTLSNAGTGAASGTTFNGSAAVTISYNSVGAAATNQTMNIGTTAVAINRASANLALTGISSIALPGATSGTVTLQPTAAAGTTTLTLPATSGTVLTTSNSITVNGTSVSLNTGGTITANTPNSLTFNNGGAGATSGTTFNGSAATTISYNSIGAAPLASPAFTGTPTAPTATAGTNTTQVATTAFVVTENSANAKLASSNTFSAAQYVPGGSVSAPGLAFSGDTDTGVYSPGANQIALGAGGIQQVYVNSSTLTGGGVGFRATAPVSTNTGGVFGLFWDGSNGAASIATADGAVLNVNRMGSDGAVINIRQGGTTEGTIEVAGTTVSYLGAHLARWSQIPGLGHDNPLERPEILRGTVMTNLDEMCEWPDPDSGDLQNNEQLNKAQVSSVDSDKNVAGVFCNWDNEDETWQNDFVIAMTGDFIIRIAEGVVVEKGDLLVSAGDGTARVQDDDIIRSCTIAKVSSNHVTCTYADGSYCVPCALMAC